MNLGITLEIQSSQCVPQTMGVENTEYFLQLCHSYSELRSDLLNSVNAIYQVLLKFILYGDERLTIDTNTKLLEATLKFIHASERF